MMLYHTINYAPTGRHIFLYYYYLGCLRKVPRRIFRPRRDEVTGGCRELHNGEFYNLCSSQNIIRMIKTWRVRWTRHVTCMGEMRNAKRIFVGKPEGNVGCF
jgi:hypothetical protein